MALNKQLHPARQRPSMRYLPVLAFCVWRLFLPGKFLREHEVNLIYSPSLPVNQPLKSWAGSPSPCLILLQGRKYWLTHPLVHLAIYFTYSHSTGLGKKHGPPNQQNFMGSSQRPRLIHIYYPGEMLALSKNKPTTEWYLFNKYQILHPSVQSTRNTAEKNPCPCRAETLEAEKEFTGKK